MSRAASLRVLASPAQLRGVSWPPRILHQAASPLSTPPQLRQPCRRAAAFHSACLRPHCTTSRPAFLRVSAPMASSQPAAAVQTQVAQSPAEAATAPATEEADATANGLPHQHLRKLEELTWENTFVDELPGDTNTENNVRIVRTRASLCFQHELRGELLQMKRLEFKLCM